jgi:hypothetical protein
MGLLEKIRKGMELIDTIGTIVSKAGDLAEARELVAKAAQRGDLDVALGHVQRGQARAKQYEDTGK